MKLEEARNIVKEYKKDDGELPATLYVPIKEYSELYQEYRRVHKFDEIPPKVEGVEIKDDVCIKEPRVIPDEIDSSFPLHMKDPPQDLISRMMDLEDKKFTDAFRGRIIQTTGYAWLKPFCVWQRFDEEMVEKYGHPISTKDLDVRRGEDCEFTKTEFETYERTKFGTETSMSLEIDAADFDIDEYHHRRVEDGITKAVHDFLWDINVKNVIVDRKRTIKGPFPVLDIEHTEELIFGKHMTTYEGMLMRHVDSQVHELHMNI